MNKKIIAILFLLFLGIVLFLRYQAQSKRRNYKFQGRIENIYFDVKMIPTIVVNKKPYYLLSFRHFKEDVEVGDLAIKKSGERNLKIIKKSNGRILNYKLWGTSQCIDG